MQNIEELRDRIFLLLGKHLIRFQTIEIRLKALLKLNRTIIFEKDLPPILIEPTVKNQTLGGLGTKALNSLFIVEPIEAQKPINESVNGIRFDMNVSFNLCEHNHQRLSSQFQEFITDRNFLTHNFQEKYNLTKLDECQQAISYLLELEKKHESFLNHFEQYCLSAQQVIDDQLSFLKSNIIKTHFIFTADQIYKEIQASISKNTKNDGWISLTTLVQSIHQKFPNTNKYIKKEYGFKNLHDLILNSGLFLLKTVSTNNGEKLLVQLNNGEATFEVIEN